MRRKRLHGILHAHYEGHEGLITPVFQDERYIEKDFHFGFCCKCGKPIGDNPTKLRLYVMGDDKKFVEECPENSHEEQVGPRFDFEGTCNLMVGDHLTIFSKNFPKQELWSGVIRSSLPRNSPNYREPYLDECVPAGIPENKWFMWFEEEYPATFLPRLGHF